jgi:signal transduction histidine kinase
VPAVSRVAVERVLARAKTSPGDALLAVAVLALVAVELHNDDTAQGPVVGAVALAAVATLAWRRTWPAVVAPLVLLGALLLAVTATDRYGPQFPFVAVLLAVYTAAVELAGRRAVVVGAATLALVVVSHVATADGDGGDFLPWLVWGAPWAAGRLVRRRTLESVEAGRRAAHAEQHRDAQLREAAAAERDRIARELHDVVAHGVSLMVVQAGAERLRLGDDQARTREVLDGIEQAGRTALGELRAMLAVLREPGSAPPEGRRPQPTMADLPALLEQVRAAGLQVTLHGALPSEVPPALGLSAYRIVQEALTNVLKHAPGEPARVVVGQEAGHLVLQVVNPLPGVPRPAGSGPGRGLLGMAERAALHGGTITSGPVDGRWQVAARLPLPVPAPA